MRRSSQEVHSLGALKAHIATGNAEPILREIATALAKLLDTGDPTIIDLGALPFSAGDEKRLDAVLGTGELHATLDVLGQSHVTETGIAGVWRIDHFDQQGETLSRFVEVTFCPDILKTQRADAETGLARLEGELQRQGAPVV
ncbi:MAG: hypothetical protein KDK10_06650 [Maritimibacter sp.]|nr:hypothetical protein [Maritimibacter sp.]